MQPLVRVRGLGARYLTRRLPALCDVTFDLARGERVLLAGASGSGKSTLGLCLAGLIPSSIDADLSGQVEIAGRPTTEYPPGSLAALVGTVFQDPSSQFTMLTVEDEVAFGLENLGVEPAAMPDRVACALAAVGLVDRARWRIDRLSGGQQQRVALAAALAMQPSTLVLDEPSAHLDPRGATELYEVLHASADATAATLVFIEHDLDRIVPRHAARGILLDRGGSVAADALLTQTFSDRSTARAWAAQGVRLPAPTALALALADEGRLPVSIADGAAWLAHDSQAQTALAAAASRSRATRIGKPVICARGLWQRYVAPATTYVGLRDVDFSVAEGELVALVGANGSGKSTLLRALSGLVKLERGEVAIGGRPLHTLTARQVAALVAHVFQNPEAGFVAATVEDELAYGPRALDWRTADIHSHTRALLERFGLAPLARANPYTLSEGQKRRLSVAASLILGPRALLLDEPTFGQDRLSARALMEELAALREHGLAIVVATHDLSLVSEIADRVVALEAGSVVFDGTPAELIGDPRLLERTGQEVPPLDQVLRAARAIGARVPESVRWSELQAA
jgi:energy-coupling factor transport system ATP-binding protein